MDFVFELPNSLSKEKCEEIIKLFEEDTRKGPGVVGRPAKVCTIKKSLDLMISPHKEWKDLDEYLHTQLAEGVKKYREHLSKLGVGGILDFIFDRGNVIDSGYQIQKTTLGEYYGWHSDSSVSDRRFLTFLWYLTGHDSLSEGGRTAFHPCAGDGGKLVVPEQGKLIIFPATWTYLHSGLVFSPSDKSRIKYICTGWLHSPDA